MKIITVILMAIVMCLSVAACAPANNESDVPEENSKTTNAEIEVSDLLTCPEFTAEQKTSAMIDQIAMTAKEHAADLTDEQANEIIQAIIAADHEFYNGSEEMEKYMWYASLLDYKYDDSDPRSMLGTDLMQAIKYVYRGAESVLDDSTKENLDQVDKDIALIG